MMLAPPGESLSFLPAGDGGGESIARTAAQLWRRYVLDHR